MKITSSGNPRAPFEVSFIDGGKRKKKRFVSKLDAKAFLETIKSEKNAPEELKFSVDERISFFKIKDICQKANITLDSAVEVLRKYAPQASIIPIAFKNAIKAFLNDCNARGARTITIEGYLSKLNRFANAFNGNVCDVNFETAQNYLNSIKSPEHAKRVLRAFFNFCIKNKWAMTNPFAEAQTPRILREKAHPSIITPDDCRKLLNAVPVDWQPAFALMAFAGLRPGEVVSPEQEPVIKIANIDFKNKRITVPAEVAKTRMIRVLTDLPANIWTWLAPLQKLPKDNNVAPASYEVCRRVKRDSGVPIPKDALRHSFASYGYHFLGAEKTVEMLGHIGGFGVFAKHYKGLATPDDAKLYFAI